MNLPVDMVIPAAPKDYSKLPFMIEAVRKFVVVETIHIIAPDPVELNGVVWHKDSDVLPYARDRLTYRPNWIFQQLLKMFQDVTANDWFLVMDADIFPSRNIPLWDGDKPILYLGRDQLHGPYFTFNEKLLGFGKVYPWSFLSECTLYSKKLVRQMLEYCKLTMDEFWEMVVQNSNLGCHIGDAEFYGSYIFQEHPGVYAIKHLEATLGGRYGSYVWPSSELAAALHNARAKSPRAHLVSLHSWEGGV